MLVGNSGVGKTTLVSSFLGLAMNNIKSTEGVDIFFKRLKINQNTVMNLNLWDFSGRREYAKIRQEFYCELHGIIYVFSLNDSSSLNNIENWLRETKKYLGDKLYGILVGTKSDLTRDVTQNDIDSICSKYKLGYYEVSAYTGINVEKMFEDYSVNLFDILPKEKKR